MKLIDRRKFLNTTRIYKEDPSDVVFRKYAVRRLIKAQPVVNAIPIPEGATNGDIIKAMFPNAQIDYHKANELVEEYVTFYINGCDTCQDYTLEWWNAPYKEV